MRTKRVVAGVAGAGLVALASFAPTLAERPPASPAFDPLYASGATCGPVQGGRPLVLGQLVLAQAETRPFTPGQQLPRPAGDGRPPLYNDLGTLHVPITTRSSQAQAFFDQGMRLAFSFNHAEAARAFRAAQQDDPKWLIEVYRQRGDAAALAAARKRFETTWLGQPGGPALSLL